MRTLRARGADSFAVLSTDRTVAPRVPTFDFEPMMHVHYGETVKDLPNEMGGSGVAMAD